MMFLVIVEYVFYGSSNFDNLLLESGVRRSNGGVRRSVCFREEGGLFYISGRVC